MCSCIARQLPPQWFFRLQELVEMIPIPGTGYLWTSTSSFSVKQSKFRNSTEHIGSRIDTRAVSSSSPSRSGGLEFNSKPNTRSIWGCTDQEKTARKVSSNMQFPLLKTHLPRLVGILQSKGNHQKVGQKKVIHLRASLLHPSN